MGLFSFEIQAKVSSLLAVMSQYVALVTPVTSSDKTGGLVGWQGASLKQISLSSAVCQETTVAFEKF